MSNPSPYPRQIEAERLYADAIRANTRSIHPHLPLLRGEAHRPPTGGYLGKRIVEFGTGRALSTLALRLGSPAGMITTFDLQRIGSRARDFLEAGGPEPRFVNLDIRRLTRGDLGPIDLLFIDDDHSYEQVRWELETFSPEVNHTIVLHDTHSTRWPGVKKALVAFLKSPQWKLKWDCREGHGMTAIKRVLLPPTAKEANPNEQGNRPTVS